MASGPTIGGDDGPREKQRYMESKVYTRKAFKGPKNKANAVNAPASIPPDTANTSTKITADADPAVTSNSAVNDDAGNKNKDDISKNNNSETVGNRDAVVDDKDKDQNKNHDNNVSIEPLAVTSLREDGNTTQQPIITRVEVISDDSRSVNRLRQDEPSSIDRLPQDEPSSIGRLPQDEPSNIDRFPQDEPSSIDRLPQDETSNIDRLPQDEPSSIDRLPQDEPSNIVRLPQDEPSSIDRLPQDEPSSIDRLPQDEPSSINRLYQDELPSCNPGQREEHSGISLQQQDNVPITRYLPSANGSVKQGSEGRVKIDELGLRKKQEARDLRMKLENELDTVRSLVRRIEAKQGHIGGYGNSNMMMNDRLNNGGGAKRAHSEAALGVISRKIARPFHQLNVSVMDNIHGGCDIIEKEKRTPKANQFYHSSEFLLGKDKFPPAESNKKPKSNGRKLGGGEMGEAFGTGTKFWKGCNSLLEKLMKHKHGWVFNTPVDAQALGLHDYHNIISHPMDLGTVKSRLSTDWYKSPKEFAEDVKLTFRNAMIYNPKGQDVHIMAEQMSKIFEVRWTIIESDYNREIRHALDFGTGFATPTPLYRKSTPLRPPPLDMFRILDRSESMANSADKTPKSMTLTPFSRTPALKKPKAKDPNKRDMTFEEKQKLSSNLQSLPSEKLDAIVQIIKRRNSSLFQDDDEIEVDIDSVDAETLWELDRFVTNYKKSLSKYKRKAELAVQAKAEAIQNVSERVPVVAQNPTETITGERNVSAPIPTQPEKQVDDGSRSSSSSSSSSDSGSSSSDSDSESSSASGSDAGSQKS